MTVKVNSVKPFYRFNTYGTSGMGYIERMGVVVNLTNGSNIYGYYSYSSKAYGTFKEVKNPNEYYGLNERFLPKYNTYKARVMEHFNKLFSNLENKLVGNSFKNEAEIKRILRYPN